MNRKIEKHIEYLQAEIEDRIKQNMTSVEKGHQFLLWALNTMFGKVETEIDNDFDNGDVIILDGKDDGGIDACFIENNELNIIQTKYKSSHGQESTSYFINQMKKLFIENKSVSPRTNEIIQRTTDRGITNIKLFYITNGVKRIQTYNNSFNNDNFYIKYHALGIADIVDFLNERYAPIPNQIKKIFKLMVESHFTNKEKNTIVAEVSLKEIAKLVWNGKDYLYHSNIRNHLGKNKVNKKIENTLKDNPKNFWFYNNGITIVCNNFECISKPFKNGVAEIKIHTPQIVNGCQTTKTIFNYMYPKNKKRDDFNCQEGTILVKIIKDTNEKRKEITRYTNSQTAVSGKDFYALEAYQHQLKDKFKKLGYNYEIQTKAYIEKEYKGNIKYDYLFDDNFTKRKVRTNTISKKMANKINVNDSTQAYVAGFLSKPAKAKTKSNYTPDTKLYEKIYNDEYSPQDARYFLFPYAIMYYYRKVKNKNIDKGKNYSLFFCHVYFKVMLQIFKEMNLMPKDATSFVEDVNMSIQNRNIDIIDRIIKNQKINKDILAICEDIVIDFFLDGKISELVGDNLPRFLKSNVETSIESKEVLKKQIHKQLHHKTDILSNPILTEIINNQNEQSNIICSECI